MSFKSILVNLDLDQPAAPLAKAAASLAGRFGARLIGFSAAAIPPPVALPEGIAYDGTIWQVEQEEINRRFDEFSSQENSFYWTALKGLQAALRGAPAKSS